MEDANFATGSNGLIAVDKIGNQILFLDPRDICDHAHARCICAACSRAGHIARPQDRLCADLRRRDPRQESTPWPSDRLVRSGGAAACRRFQHLPLSRAARTAVGPAGTALLRVREQRRRARDGCRHRRHSAHDRGRLRQGPSHRGDAGRVQAVQRERGGYVRLLSSTSRRASGSRRFLRQTGWRASACRRMARRSCSSMRRSRRSWWWTPRPMKSRGPCSWRDMRRPPRSRATARTAST